MSAQLAVEGFPSAEGTGIGKEAGIYAPAVQESCAIDPEEPGAVAQHILFKTAVEQPDVFEVEALGLYAWRHGNFLPLQVLTRILGIGATAEKMAGGEERCSDKKLMHDYWLISIFWFTEINLLQPIEI